MSPKHPLHSVDSLRLECQKRARRPFIARGSKANRCPSCLMATFACFCTERKTAHASINFILLFHRDEIHKPTNSGRLIADCYPADTLAFLWDRTQPDDALKALLEERKGACTLLYPHTETAKRQKRHVRTLPLPNVESNTKHTFIILDGTWKQASKMFHQSEWLKDIPHFEINSQAQRSFLVRHSGHDMQFATAEVIALLLDNLGYEAQSRDLLHYYQVFNQKCLASRKRGDIKEWQD
ncbi:tRNA-uridine aminocarboxypropyltransferase [Marinomonas flavescens]|uniref:tRNA-uridine aminocarboxypropyltransferase n=1 Tax=Marinomonas flavescens TaxID=2529379 RepID=UPI001056DC4B|nr:DTW domain-containing protein [Marinomonas flavescens]